MAYTKCKPDPSARTIFIGKSRKRRSSIISYLRRKQRKGSAWASTILSHVFHHDTKSKRKYIY